MTSTSNWAFYERHFATSRLQHYLAHAQGDHVAAMELYRWNASISGAFWQSFAYFEVAFRNAIDARMVERHSVFGRSGSGTSWSPAARCSSGLTLLARFPTHPTATSRRFRIL